VTKAGELSIGHIVAGFSPRRGPLCSCRNRRQGHPPASLSVHCGSRFSHSLGCGILACVSDQCGGEELDGYICSYVLVLLIGWDTKH